MASSARRTRAVQRARSSGLATTRTRPAPEAGPVDRPGIEAASGRGQALLRSLAERSGEVPAPFAPGEQARQGEAQGRKSMPVWTERARRRPPRRTRGRACSRASRAACAARPAPRAATIPRAPPRPRTPPPASRPPDGPSRRRAAAQGHAPPRRRPPKTAGWLSAPTPSALLCLPAEARLAIPHFFQNILKALMQQIRLPASHGGPAAHVLARSVPAVPRQSAHRIRGRP